MHENVVFRMNKGIVVSYESSIKADIILSIFSRHVKIFKTKQAVLGMQDNNNKCPFERVACNIRHISVASFVDHHRKLIFPQDNVQAHLQLHCLFCEILSSTQIQRQLVDKSLFW